MAFAASDLMEAVMLRPERTDHEALQPNWREAFLLFVYSPVLLPNSAEDYKHQGTRKWQLLRRWAYIHSLWLLSTIRNGCEPSKTKPIVCT